MPENSEIQVFENTFKSEIAAGGTGLSTPCRFPQKFGNEPGLLPVEAGRYRILWMPACPHAHRIILARKLLGLEDVISLGATGPWREPRGWVFTEDPGEVDPVLGIHYLQEAYLKGDPEYSGRPTVPAVVDLTTGQVVNNDYFWLSIDLETAWKPFYKKGAPDLYPQDLRTEIDELNQYIFHNITDGFYEPGFAQDQESYSKGYSKLFDTLDYLENRLSRQRYLFGDRLTDADIRLYPSLVRWYLVYYYQFLANKKHLKDYPALWGFARDLYQTEGVAETTQFDFIKKSYQQSPHLKFLWGNEHGLLSKGPEVNSWKIPHGREKLRSF